MSLHTLLPANEAERQAAVNSIACFEGIQDELFDELINTAMRCFDVPIALISILDANRQWFWAKSGLAAEQTPRVDAFCAFAILTNDYLEVTDVIGDERFRDNPLVTGEPGIRFYAGCPLVTEDGLGLGALCIIDTKPRPPLSPEQRALLQQFAALVMLRINHLRTEAYIEQPIGLFNRFKFERDVEAFKAGGLPVTVVAIDVISPAFLNEIVKALGYPFSAHLMSQLKERLLDVLGDRTLYKISPTRFGFLMPGNSDVDALIPRLLQAFSLPILCAGIPLQPKTGLGVFVQEAGQWNEDWLRLLVSSADHARHSGTGWARYDPQMDLAQVRAFKLLGSLSAALEADDQLHLEYQPRVDAATGHMVSVEALLRWRHPELGAIGPGEFIQLAEKTALIGRISRWVARQAIQQAAAWQRLGHRWQVSINASVADMEDASFADYLIDQLESQSVDPTCIELEFTESAVMTRPVDVLNNLRRLRELGVGLAIDDFGTGYSNWSYLRDLPASTVKLDQSFMRDLLTDKRDQAVVQSIIQLARSLDYLVVAEGVETLALYEQMKAWGCDEIQGYHIARPMTAQALEAWHANDPARKAAER